MISKFLEIRGRGRTRVSVSEIQVWALGIGIHAVLTTSSDLTFKLSDWDFSLRPLNLAISGI